MGKKALTLHVIHKSGIFLAVRKVRKGQDLHVAGESPPKWGRFWMRTFLTTLFKHDIYIGM